MKFAEQRGYISAPSDFDNYISVSKKGTSLSTKAIADDFHNLLESKGIDVEESPRNINEVNLNARFKVARGAFLVPSTEGTLINAPSGMVYLAEPPELNS